MFAIARLNTFDPDKLTEAQPELDQFARLHASQPGYAGSLTIDLGDGRRLTSTCGTTSSMRPTASRTSAARSAGCSRR